MKSQTQTVVGAIMLGLMGFGLLYLALAPRKPDWNVTWVVGAIAVCMQAGGLALAFTAIQRWSYGRGGPKGRSHYTLDLRGPTLLRIAPIRGHGPGLVQFLVSTVGVAEGIPYTVRIVELTPTTREPTLAADHMHTFNIHATRPIDMPVDHHVRHTGEWELMAEINWEEKVFRSGLLRNLRQFSREMLIEVIVCGRCSDVLVPVHPVVEAAPLDEGRRGFEVIVKK